MVQPGNKAFFEYGQKESAIYLFSACVFFIGFGLCIRLLRMGSSEKNCLLILIYDHIENSVESLFGAESFHTDTPAA